MHRCLHLLALLVLLSACSTGAKPDFGEYPATENFRGKNAPLSTRTENEYFNTILAEAAGRSVNFAGHYIVYLYGCGDGCITGGVIDAKSGANVADLPDNYVSGDKPPSFSLEHWQSSTLMVITGKPIDSDAGVTTRFYQFDNDEFTLLSSSNQ